MSDDNTSPGADAPTIEDTLAAVMLLDSKFDRLLSIATQCFEALQEIPKIRDALAGLELRVAVLERAARDTDRAPPP